MDSLHVIKLGIARHFIASAIVVFGEWNVFPGAAESVSALLETSHEDFLWSCQNELHQTPHLKMFSKEGLHWPRRQSFPWGGSLLFRNELFAFVTVFLFRAPTCRKQ